MVLKCFLNIYDNTCTFDSEDFSGRQLAYDSDFVSRMPKTSMATWRHEGILALHQRVSDLVLSQRDYWDGPMESSDFRVYAVEYLPAHKDGMYGYDLSTWLHDMLCCVETFDPHYAEEVSDYGSEEEGEAQSERIYFFKNKEEREKLAGLKSKLEEDIKAMMVRLGV